MLSQTKRATNNYVKLILIYKLFVFDNFATNKRTYSDISTQSKANTKIKTVFVAGSN